MYGEVNYIVKPIADELQINGKYLHLSKAVGTFMFQESRIMVETFQRQLHISWSVTFHIIVNLFIGLSPQMTRHATMRDRMLSPQNLGNLWEMTS